MSKRIFRSLLMVSLGVLLACLVLIIGVLHDYFENRVLTEAAKQTTTIANGYRLAGTEYLETLQTESRITLIAPDGAVRYDNRAEPEDMENHGNRPEIKAALSTGTGHAIRRSNTLSQDTIYYAEQLENGTVLRVSNTVSSIWLMLLQVLQPVAFITTIAVAFALFLSSRVSKQIVTPLNHIDLSHPEKGKAYEELTPFLEKIRSQNRQIERQMNTLRQQQEEFTAIMENMEEGVLVTDCKMNVLSCNSAALRLLGAKWTPNGEEVSVFRLNRESAFRTAIEKALNGQHNEQKMEQDGGCRQVIASPVWDTDGVMQGAVFILMDITEREQRDRLRREFTANVSHELKTPLTAILGTAEIMQNGLVRPEDISHFSHNIHKEAGRLIELVNDIIKLSRLDEGGFSAEWQRLDLYALAENVLEQVRPAAEAKQISLLLTGSNAEITALPQIAEELVYNLCDNAITYNKSGGSVTVTVAQEAEHIVLTVTDTGVGIPPEDQSRVFERFYRGDKSHSTDGTGLGLSIVKHGAAYLGASVQIESTVGQGTTFTVVFPLPE